jgi:hypothetical protein
MVARTVLLIVRVGICPKRIAPWIFAILWPDAACDGIADDNGIITFRFEDARATHQTISDPCRRRSSSFHPMLPLVRSLYAEFWLFEDRACFRRKLL